MIPTNDYSDSSKLIGSTGTLAATTWSRLQVKTSSLVESDVPPNLVPVGSGKKPNKLTMKEKLSLIQRHRDRAMHPDAPTIVPPVLPVSDNAECADATRVEAASIPESSFGEL